MGPWRSHPPEGPRRAPAPRASGSPKLACRPQPHVVRREQEGLACLGTQTQCSPGPPAGEACRAESSCWDTAHCSHLRIVREGRAFKAPCRACLPFPFRLSISWLPSGSVAFHCFFGFTDIRQSLLSLETSVSFPRQIKAQVFTHC